MTCESCWWNVRAWTDLYTWCINPKSEYLNQDTKNRLKCPLFIDRELPIPDKEDEKYIRAHTVQLQKLNRIREDKEII